MSNYAQVIEKATPKLMKTFEGAKNVELEKEIRFVMSILNNNEYLAKIANDDPQSLLSSISNIAAIGLSLNPAEKQAYLIPRNIKIGSGKGQYVSRIFLEPSYMGLCKLATDSGAIKWIQAKCVYANDSFIDNGAGIRPTHSYDPFSTDRGDFVGAYCVAKTEDDDYLTNIMTAEQVYSIRGRSESYKRNQSGVWVTDFEQMTQKAVTRQGFKMWPKSTGSAMAQAVEWSNNNEGFEPIVTAPNLGSFTGQQKEYFDNLIENYDALGMFVFRATLDEEQTFTSLCHSFEKGTKTKYRKVVDELTAKGQEVADEYVNRLSDATVAGDDLATREILDELSQDELNVILERCDSNVTNEINAIREAA